jgi:hypothetical protein
VALEAIKYINIKYLGVARLCHFGTCGGHKSVAKFLLSKVSVNHVWGKLCPSARRLVLLLAATCAMACGLNPQPEPPLSAPNSGPVASATGGGAGTAGEGGGGGDDTGSVTAGMENGPGGPGMGGGGAGNDLGVGGGVPVATPDDVRDADAAAGFLGDSGTFDASGSVGIP